MMIGKVERITKLISKRVNHSETVALHDFPQTSEKKLVRARSKTVFEMMKQAVVRDDDEN